MSEILRKRARSYAYKTFLLAVDRLRLAERGKQPIAAAMKEVSQRLEEFRCADAGVQVSRGSEEKAVGLDG